MDLSVEHGCPQCGAPVSIAESDRFSFCPFCKVSNYIINPTGARYALPCGESLDQESGDLYFIPYIRFRGSVFLVSGREISHRIVDTTQLGFTDLLFPPSLGLRPQAMKLLRVSPQTSGRFLPLTIKTQSILARAANLSAMASGGDSQILHRAYIGESLSFIYMPVRQEEKNLFDAVTNSALSPVPTDTFLEERSKPFQRKWQSDFIAALCPQCGWELKGEGDCLAVPCDNCDTVWEVSAKGLQKLEWQQGESQDTMAMWLPFWKISTAIPELSIRTFADYARVTRQPSTGGRPKKEEMMSFFIPAFKVRPKVFLQTATRMTSAQNLFHPAPGGGHISRRYPANLALSEARQALKITLAASTLNKKEVYPLLPRIRFTNVCAKLVYLPFHDDGHDLIQKQSGVAIAKNVLSWGKKL
ncbi:MAG: hypothetical protein KKA54_12725 [Proteobacteria bacterium]|nr:hypothetical protein [Pseudomonadota bacterium]MBU0967230.1 hypothetical protein [Pseudomonadota bacterium]